MDKVKVLRTDEVAEERDLVGVYLHEISRTPLLDAAQEVDLSRAIEAGLYAEHLLEEGEIPDGVKRGELKLLVIEGERAKDQFIRANLRLVVSIARRYVRSGMPMLDLIQEGNTGLVRAVEKFDYVRGYKFSTYATWWIRQAISRAIAQQERTVRLPVHLVEDVNRMRNVARQLTREHGSEPEPDQLAAALGVPVERVLELMRWSQDTVSLDTPVGDDGDTNLGDLVADAGARSGRRRRRVRGQRSNQLGQLRQLLFHPLVLVGQRLQVGRQPFDDVLGPLVRGVVVVGEFGRDLVAALGGDQQDRPLQR